MLKYGIIGLGKISPLHIQSIKGSCGEIVATCDINTDKKLEYPFYTRYIDMLDNEELDVVSICTPNHLHYSMAMDILSRGIHCIIEKPMVMSIHEAELLRTRASYLKDNKGIRLFPILQNRYNPIVKYVKDCIQDGKLGKIHHIDMRQYWHRPDSYFEDWHGDNKQSGGAFLNLGIHFIDMIIYFLGSVPRDIMNVRIKHFRNLDVEDYISCDFDTGEIAGNIMFSLLASRNSLELSVIAEKGNIKLGGTTGECVELWDCNLPRPPSCDYDRNTYDGYTGSLSLHSLVYKNVRVVLTKDIKQDVVIEDAIKGIKFINRIYEKGE